MISRTLAGVAAGALLLGALSGCTLVERARDLVERAGGGPVGDESYEPGDIDYFQLRPGVCFDDDDLEGAVYSAECAGDHYNEVYATIPAEGGYPGDVELYKVALLGCIDRFEDYVGRPFEESALDYWSFIVDENHWTEGETAVVCYAYDWSGLSLPSSIRDSER